MKDIKFTVDAIKKTSRAVEVDENNSTIFQELLKINRLSLEEYKLLKSIMNRAPTFAELGVFSSMWSEHCSYKSSIKHLKRFPTTGEHVVVGPGENAGVVRLSGKLCAAFKMESHNHPSYIEPYQGAATGVGGILRDVFCMGARPIANLNCLHFGSKKHPRTPYLFPQVVKGVGDYGNCMGIPTVGGRLMFDDTYNGNCLVNAMSVGLIHEDRIFKGYASGVGNYVVYVGSATGRDGIHGASMASDSFDSSANEERSAVQVGDPFTEKLLMEATLEVLEKDLVVGLQDMGAAGLTSSSFEMASRANNGLFIDLNKVPTRTSGMTANELMLSESQERMLMVVEPSKWSAIEKVFKHWDLAYAIIGEVTETSRVQAVYNNKLEIDIPVGPITDSAPRYDRPMEFKTPLNDPKFDQVVVDTVNEQGLSTVLNKAIELTGDKEKLYEQYDRHVGAKTVLSSEQEGAAVQWLRSEWSDPSEPNLGMVVATGVQPAYCVNDPKEGAAHSMLKAVRMVVAAGGTPLAATDCLNYGNPEVPEIMGQFSAGVDGISETCRQLDVPIVSGNVSLYNETDGSSIDPTPMMGVVGKIKDVSWASPAIVSEESELFLVSGVNTKPSFGASLVSGILGFEKTRGQIPIIDWQAERQAMSAMVQLSQHVLAARDVASGGVLVCAIKMGLANGFGLTLDAQLGVLNLLGERSASYLIAVKSESVKTVEEISGTFDQLSLTRLGRYTTDGEFGFEGLVMSLDDAKSLNRGLCYFN